jgi:hypothetical protein
MMLFKQWFKKRKFRHFLGKKIQEINLGNDFIRVIQHGGLVCADYYPNRVNLCLDENDIVVKIFIG